IPFSHTVVPELAGTTNETSCPVSRRPSRPRFHVYKFCQQKRLITRLGAQPLVGRQIAQRAPSRTILASSRATVRFVSSDFQSNSEATMEWDSSEFTQYVKRTFGVV